MIEIKENEPLDKHASFHIGGPAKYFTTVKNSAELQEALEFAGQRKIAYKLIGGGSNILFSDQGYDGLIIRLFGGEIKINDEIVEADAGAPLALVLHRTLEAGLGGLEWAIGIPGTIGGATYNNAGAYGGEMSQSIIGAKVLIDGEIKQLSGEEFGFGYRNSAFKTGIMRGAILSVKLQLKKVSAEESVLIKDKMAENLADRLSKTAEGGSAGSTFRNIILSAEEIAGFKQKFPQLPDRFIGYKKIPSAWLIDECGLRGKKIGQAMVSEKHAGKITNLGGATAEHVIMLISIVKQKVRSRFSLQLMEEIEYVGFEASK